MDWSDKATMKNFVFLKIFLFLLFGAVIVFSLLTPKPVSGYGDEFRIFYYHVPCAIVSFIAFFVNLVYSIRYLRTKEWLDDLKAASAAEIGLMFSILATLTGSIFAKLAWGAYWNWDIRETSIVVMLAVYGAYFALRAAVEPESRRAAFSAVYAILAFIAVPTFGIIVPRLYQSLHPRGTIIAQGRIALGGTVALVFFGSLLAFVILFFWLFNLRWRTGSLERSRLEKSYE